MQGPQTHAQFRAMDCLGYLLEIGAFGMVNRLVRCCLIKLTHAHTRLGRFCFLHLVCARFVSSVPPTRDVSVLFVDGNRTTREVSS